MPRQENNPSSTANDQDNKGIHKENEKSPENKLKDMEMYDLNYREFKTAVLKKKN